MNQDDLEIWKKSVDFAHEIYRLADSFPRSDIYDIGVPLRRAAASIPKNIAEAADGVNLAERSHFMQLVVASLTEIETQLGIAKKLGYTANYRQLRRQVTTLQAMAGTRKPAGKHK